MMYVQDKNYASIYFNLARADKIFIDPIKKRIKLTYGWRHRHTVYLTDDVFEDVMDFLGEGKEEDV